MVFSAKGTQTKSNRRSNTSSNPRTRSNPISLDDLPLESPSTQLIVLRELESRLKVMVVAEELDVSSLNEEDYNTSNFSGTNNLMVSSGSGRGLSSLESKSLPFFGGSSGFLLVELENAISNIPNSEEQEA